MVASKQSIPEAYRTLGVEEGSSLEVVKSSYKRLALSTHPDKNPDNADATAQFQKVSEAYNLLVKHLDKSTRPPRGPFGFGSSSSSADYDYDSDEYYDSDDVESEEEMEYYMWLFAEFIRGRAGRSAQSRFHHEHRRPGRVPESEEEYQARLRRSREEQVAAEERRQKEDADRKAKLEKERIREKEEKEQRQKTKKANKKGEAEALRKKAEDAARAQQQRAQTLRSATFAAARAGDAAKVKKGVWEDNVDAAGGEIKKGCEGFVITAPADPKETLMHIAVKNGDADLVQWLDAHSAEPDERNSQGLTAFHLAVKLGHIHIIREPFFANYPPKESDHSAIYSAPPSTSILHLAIDSCEPEVVWMVLNNGISSSQDTSKAWTHVSSSNWKESMKKRPLPGGRKVDDQNLDEIRHLLMVFGGFTPPPTPTAGVHDKQWESATVPPRSGSAVPETKSTQQKQKQKQPIASNPQPPGSAAPRPKSNGSRGGRARGRGRGPSHK